MSSNKINNQNDSKNLPSKNLTKKRKIKKHISFKENLVCTIDVDCWKEYNIDFSELKKIKPNLYKNVISINTNVNEKKIIYKCNIF